MNKESILSHQGTYRKKKELVSQNKPFSSKLSCEMAGALKEERILPLYALPRLSPVPKAAK